MLRAAPLGPSLREVHQQLMAVDEKVVARRAELCAVELVAAMPCTNARGMLTLNPNLNHRP